MSEQPPQDLRGRRLDGWKEISDFLKVTTRHAQRWETEFDLPVHREVGAGGSRVYAFTSELDAWRAAKQRPPLVTPVTAEPDVAVPQSAPIVDTPKPAHMSRLWIAVAVGMVLTGIFVARYLERRPLSTGVPAARARPWTRFLWRATAEGAQFTIVTLPEAPEYLTVSPDNRRVYLTSRGRDLLMELDTQTLAVGIIPLPAPAWTIAMAADGRKLYVGSTTGRLFLVNAVTRRVEWEVQGNGPIRALAVTPDGRQVYAAMVFQGAYRLDVETKQWKKLTLVGSPTSVDLDHTGKRLMIGYMNGGPTGRDGHDAVEVIDVETEKRLALFSGPPLVGGSHRFTADGRYLWLDGADACSATHYDHQGCPSVPSAIFYLYRLEDQKVVKTVSIPPWRRSYMLDDRGQFFATGHAIHSFDASRLADIEFFAPGYVIHQAAISPDGMAVYLPRSDSMDTPAHEVWILRSEPDECTPSSGDLTHFFAMDGTGNDNLGSSHILPREELQFAPGFTGQALRVGTGGSNPAIDTNLSYPDFGQADFTLSFYVKPLRPPDGDPLFGIMKGDNPAWSISAFRESIRLDGRPNGGPPVSLAVNAKLDSSRWTAVAFTKGRDSLSLYIDGRFAGRVPVPDRKMEFDSLDGHLHIGALPTTSKRLHALIDEVATWSRTLSADEIRDVYDRRLKPECRTAAMH